MAETHFKLTKLPALTPIELDALRRLSHSLSVAVSASISSQDVISVLAECGLDDVSSRVLLEEILYVIRSWFDYLAENRHRGSVSGKDAFVAVFEAVELPEKAADHQLIDALVALAHSPRFVALAKAKYLFSMAGSIFAGARIVSSATPIFGENNSEPLKSVGYFVGHRLRLQYWGEQALLNEIHIELTHDDIDSLLDTLQRSKLKSAELEKLAKTSYPLVKI